MSDNYFYAPRWQRTVFPIVGVLILLTGWYYLATYVVANPTLMPDPISVFKNVAAWGGQGWFETHFVATVIATLVGLVIGASLGFLFGIVVSEVETLYRVFHPIVQALQAMPVVAIAPLVIVWFGIGLASKIALVAIGTFFVMFIHTVAGMRAVSSELVDMAKAFGGGRWRIVFLVKIKSALDYVFSGLEVCAALSFILCVVGEFLAAKAGIGYYLRAASYDIDATAMFSAVFVLALLATLLAFSVRVLHHRLVFWKYSKQ